MWTARRRHWLLFALIFALGVFLRLYRLDVTQPAFAPDEIDYFLSAKAVAYTGRDLTGTIPFASFTPFAFPNPMAELAPVFQLPTMSWLPITPLTVKLLPVILSLSLMIAVYQLAYTFCARKGFALLAMLAVAINPWAVFLGRTAYDAPVALVLLTWSFLALCRAYRAKTTKSQIIYAALWLPLFAAGFFTYHGLKIPALLITIVLSLYFLSCKTNPRRTQIVLITFFTLTASVIFAANSFFLIRAGTRTSEISLLNFGAYTTESDTKRRLNLAPDSLLTKIFDNSRFIWAFNLLVRYGQTYNLSTLFLSGVNGFQSGVWDYGQFHLPTLLLIAAALYLLLARQKYREIILILALLAVIPTTYAIKTEASYFVYQNSFLIILFCLLAAYAAHYFLERAPKITTLALLGVYTVCLLLFTHNYFDRYPLYAEEQWYFPAKVLSRYLQLAAPRPVFFLTPSARDRLRDFIVYTDAYQPETAPLLAPLFAASDADRHWQHVTFSQNCNALDEIDPATTVIIDPSLQAVPNCSQPIADFTAHYAARQATHSAAPIIHQLALKDSGTNYLIYTDTLCSAYQLPSYSRIQDVNLLRVQKLDADTFCRHYYAIYQ